MSLNLKQVSAELSDDEIAFAKKKGWTLEDMRVYKALKQSQGSDTVRFPENPDNGWHIDGDTWY